KPLYEPKVSKQPSTRRPTPPKRPAVAQSQLFALPPPSVTAPLASTSGDVFLQPRSRILETQSIKPQLEDFSPPPSYGGPQVHAQAWRSAMTLYSPPLTPSACMYAAVVKHFAETGGVSVGRRLALIQEFADHMTDSGVPDTGDVMARALLHAYSKLGFYSRHFGIVAGMERRLEAAELAGCIIAGFEQGDTESVMGIVRKTRKYGSVGATTVRDAWTRALRVKPRIRRGPPASLPPLPGDVQKWNAVSTTRLPRAVPQHAHNARVHRFCDDIYPGEMRQTGWIDPTLDELLVKTDTTEARRFLKLLDRLDIHCSVETIERCRVVLMTGTDDETVNATKNVLDRLALPPFPARLSRHLERLVVRGDDAGIAKALSEEVPPGRRADNETTARRMVALIEYLERSGTENAATAVEGVYTHLRHVDKDLEDAVNELLMRAGR
ncbi:hypothetical protein HKX48_007645, partial [Thoreauomyces humboldtii]